MQNTPKEWKRIDRIKSLVQRQSPQTVVPLGDDAFVFRSFKSDSVIAQDMMVQDVHFKLEWSSASDLGHKALAVNLSDLAAMGAHAHFAQVSLALPPHLTESWLDDFYLGMTKLADRFDVEIVGGDLCASPKALVIDVSVYGSTATPLTRTGTQAGDLLLASGPLGLSATGFLALEKKIENEYPQGLQRHLRPEPRLDLVGPLQLNKNYVHALMDCSDGLVNDAMILAGPRLGIHFYPESLPVHEESKKFAISHGRKELDLPLWGGEDYELLMSVAPEDFSRFKGWHIVGQFTDSPGIFISHVDGKEEIKDFKGWRHF